MIISAIAAISFISLVFSSYYLTVNFKYKRYLKKIGCNSDSNKNNKEENTSGIKENFFILKINFIAEILGKKIKKSFPSNYYLKLISLTEELFYFNNTKISPELIIGYKVLLCILMMSAGIFILKSKILIFIGGVSGMVLGFFIPDIFLRSIIKKGILKLEKELPFIADLLFITTLSGQNIYNSLKTINEKFNSSINKQIKCFLNNINMGVGRDEAYKNISEKNSSEIFKSFIFTLKMAENYGSSISDVINRKASFLRFNIYQDFEKKTRLLSIKILFPLIFLILPAFILLVCGPLVYLIAGNLIIK